MAFRATDPPTRHSLQDWHGSNAYQYNSSERERTQAERARDEHERLRQETHERKERTQADVSKKLEQRLNDVRYWHEEVTRKEHDVQQHVQQAVAMLTRLQSALKDTEMPLEANQRCLAYRERRRGIDLVHDNVQVELLKEKDTLEGIASMLRKTISQVTEQLRLLRKSAFDLNKDLSDKNMALSIDSDCQRQSEGTMRMYGNMPQQPIIDSKSVAPPEWEDFSDTNITAAEQQCHAYAKLGAIAEDILNEAHADINSSRRDTNRAFELRIDETNEAKVKLETHLQQVEEERCAVGNDINALQTAAQEKIPALQLSNYRVSQRGDRPNIELVRDPVHYRLIEEAAELDDSIRQLHRAHAKAVVHYEALMSRHVALSEDIETKAITLRIDISECMGLRKQLPELWTGQ
ncbi:tektin-1-like [Sycon ciliatum]|uniref:tektin-1-like n=1 Tax=Sycon ciliatum TaxID=27933 RepID=UPI0020AE735F|eukprot:scpid77689/ scgid27481/ Tektin-1